MTSSGHTQANVINLFGIIQWFNILIFILVTPCKDFIWKGQKGQKVKIGNLLAQAGISNCKWHFTSLAMPTDING